MDFPKAAPALCLSRAGSAAKPACGSIGPIPAGSEHKMERETGLNAPGTTTSLEFSYRLESS